MWVALSAIALVAAGAAHAENLPDAKLTPGHVWTESRDKVCRPDYGQPAADMPAKLRYRVLINYGLGGYDRAVSDGYAIDHLISVELGGSDDIRNLWPLPNDGLWNAADKRRLTAELHARVCAGTLPLAEAQAMLVGDWIAAYRTVFAEQAAGQ